MKTINACRWQVGDRVACIEATLCKRRKKLYRPPLKLHTCYIVRGIDQSPTGEYDTDEGDEPGIYLVGQFGAICPDGSEASFSPDDFISWEEHQKHLAASRRACSRMTIWRP